MQRQLAIIRAQFFSVFSLLELDNGLLPFCYILQKVPRAERVHVFTQLPASVYVEVSARHVAGAEDMDSPYNAFVERVIV